MYNQVNKEVKSNRYTILEDIGNLEQSIESVYSTPLEHLETIDRLELRMNSLEALLRETIKGLKDAQNKALKNKKAPKLLTKKTPDNMATACDPQ